MRISSRQRWLGRGPYRWLSAVILAIIVAAVGTVAVGVSYVRTRVIAYAGHSLVLVAAGAADKLELLLVEQATAVRTLARAPMLLDGELEQQRQYLDGVLRSSPHYRWLAVVDADGRITVATDVEAAESAILGAWWHRAGQTPRVDVIASVPEGKPPQLAFTAPFTDRHGARLGTVVVATSVTAFANVFQRTNNTLEDEWGRTVRVNSLLVNDYGDVLLDSARPTGTSANLVRRGTPSVLLAASPHPGFVEELYDDQPVLTGYARLGGGRTAFDLKWSVLVRMHRRDILAPIQAPLTRLSIGGALILLPLLAVLLWTTRRLRKEWALSREESVRALSAEARARQNEGWLRAILDHAAEGIISIDADGTIQSFNDAAARIFGYQPSEVIGQGVGILMGPEDAARHPEHLTRYFSTGEAKILGRTREVEARRKDGTPFPIALAVSEVGMGRRRIFTGIVRDLTETKRAEEQFRALLESAPDAMVIVDSAGQIVIVNSQTEQLFGYVRDELLGRPFEVLVTERFRRKHIGSRAGYLSETRSRPVGANIELVGIRKDGAEVPIEINLSPLETPSGTLVTASIRDVTERRRAEEEQRKLIALIEHSSDLIAVVNLEGRILFLNKRGQTMLGLESLAEARAHSFDTFLADGDLAVMRERIMPVIRERGHWQSEFRLRNFRTGEEVPIDFTLFLLRDPDSGKAIGLASISRDLTEQKRAHAELVSAKQGAELKELAEAASRAKSEFLAVMSHEIRTPMNGVIGMTALLLDTPLTSEQREYAEAVQQSGQALLAIINDVLDFSKIEAGKLELESVAFDLRSTVEDVVSLFSERAEDKGLELACLIDPSLPVAVRGDSVRLRQVLSNLVSNAIKFTEHGEVSICVSGADEGPDALLLAVEVADTGIGMDDAQQARLFQSFSQGDTSMTRRYGGSGLGLAISKRLAEMMGGEISVTSEPGRGSRFTLTVRLAKQPSADHGEPRPGEQLRPWRVLIVDDNATSRRFLESYVRSWRMEAATAESGESALEQLRATAARRELFDVVLSDLDMGPTDGLALSRAIAADPALGAPRFVLLAAVGKRGLADAARDAGVAATLRKPVRQWQLLSCLASVLYTPDAPADFAIAVSRHSAGESAPIIPARILIAEDNVLNQRVARRMLEKRGYASDVVTTGRDAVEAVARGDYDVVFMDCQLPDMDGFAATAAIRKLAGAPGRIPIIAMTANALQGDRERCLAAGMSDYVSKPVVPADLDAALRRWTSHAGEARGADGEKVSSDDLPPSGMTSTANGGGAVRDGTTAEARAGEATSRRARGDDEAEVLDAAELLDRIDGDTQLLADLIALFIDDCPRWLSELRTAIARRDQDALHRTAHTVKGSVGNFAGKVAFAAALKLEQMGERGEFTGTDDACTVLEGELVRLKRALLSLQETTAAAS